MGYILDNCPSVPECCWSVPLRPAVFIVALSGLLWSGVYFVGFTGAGAELCTELGVSAGVRHVLQYVHGVFGILVFATNTLLAAAALYENDALCEVYLWSTAVFCVVMATSSAAVALAAALARHYALAGLYLLAMFLATLLFLYFMIIVGNYRMTLP